MYKNKFHENISRFMNFTLALLVLFLLSPVMIAMYFLVLILDGRPVFYYGQRLGKDGRIFVMYKFRTLVVGAEKVIGGRLMDDQEGYITSLGHFLRLFKLDEIPQLFNILKGDMNFVGPRPVRAAMANEYEQIVPDYHKRFLVRPGLTGLAQLRGGYYCPPRRKTRYDLFYIKKQGFVLDMKLLLLTGLRLIISPNCLKRGYSLSGRPIGTLPNVKEGYPGRKKISTQETI